VNQSALQRTSERVSSFLGLHDDSERKEISGEERKNDRQLHVSFERRQLGKIVAQQTFMVWIPKPAIIECNTDVDEIVVGEEVTVEISLTLARRKGLAE
jgi:hypothetical protein